MTARPVRAVEHGELLLEHRLGQGGQGTVHRVANRRIDEAGESWGVVYKEYDAHVLPDLDADALAAMAGLLDELGDAERRWLCGRTAWPAAVVRRQGLVLGFLMREAPDRFHFEYRGLGGPAAAARRLASLEYLLNGDAYVAGVGLEVSERDRLLLLADLAATLSRLHRLGVAVGDLSPKNLLFTTAGRPECFLIDCDAMRLRGRSALPQAETPDWQLPAGEERATPAGDVHKLALLAVRLFARDQTATDPAALGAVSPVLGDLARASLGGDPARRPTPAVWAEQLLAAAGTASTVPAAAAVPGGAGPAGYGNAGPFPLPLPLPVAPVPPPVRRTPPAAVGAGIVAVIAAVVVALVLTGTIGGGPAATDPPTPTAAATVSSPAASGPAEPSGFPDPVRTPTPSASPDPVGAATVGDCFHDYGTDTRADLREAVCAPGTFQLVRLFEGTTDLDSCDGVTDSDVSVSSVRYGRVLCLSYRSTGGTAYHARTGDCVYGANATGVAWGVQTCQTGNFKVLAVHRGTRDESVCAGLRRYNLSYSAPGDKPSSDVLLCLSMNYPDDAGYATRDQCLLVSGGADDRVFTDVGGCAGANAVVTGRSSTYDNSAFCGNHGWVTWRSRDFPDFAYTLCWRWK
ncbi:hypothetical protein ACFCX4_07155 [Kitasatospora sp. NPDC056327]|uniref:LppU/SCO3897 family protein n=1 Tax=Kitasatospora sp. NPDC056327 TaxID=3345785 RepID=UPI0035DD65FB